MSDFLSEARCPTCGWEGYWDDAEIKVVRGLYGEAWGSPAWKVVELPSCPVCGNPDLDSLEISREEPDMERLLAEAEYREER
jgi:hypothetical protein